MRLLVELNAKPCAEFAEAPLDFGFIPSKALNVALKTGFELLLRGFEWHLCCALGAQLKHVWRAIRVAPSVDPFGRSALSAEVANDVSHERCPLPPPNGSR